MALILSLESSTNVCSVSLALNGNPLHFQEDSNGHSHAEQMTQFISNVLDASPYSIKDVEAIAISKGPGSYTGLRIGVSTAKGLAYGLGIPLLGVSSLQSMSYGVSSLQVHGKNNSFESQTLLCPMIDARRMEVYCALYNIDNEEVRSVEAKVIDENSFTDIPEEVQIVFFGNGALKCKDIVIRRNSLFLPDINQTARNMVELAETAFVNKIVEDVAYFEPLYLKDFIAIESKKNVFGERK